MHVLFLLVCPPLPTPIPRRSGNRAAQPGGEITATRCGKAGAKSQLFVLRPAIPFSPLLLDCSCLSLLIYPVSSFPISVHGITAISVIAIGNPDPSSFSLATNGLITLKVLCNVSSNVHSNSLSTGTILISSGPILTV